MKKILVIGDIILDKYSYGLVKRINPEGPMPLLDITKEEYKLGGAGNVAFNMAPFADVVLVGCIGDDEMGGVVTSLCEKNNIIFERIFLDMPTTTKQRFIDVTYHQQLLRVDYERKTLLPATKIQEILHLIAKYDIEYLVISDYEKGFITPELVNELKKLDDLKIIVDSKKKDISLFTGVYLIKPNFKEFCQNIGLELSNDDISIEQNGKTFVQKYDCNLLITRSEKGASLVKKTGEVYHVLPTKTRDIFDVTGAGDTFSAFVVLALNAGYSLEDAVKKGNEASGIVVGKLGTARVEVEEINI